MPPKLKKFPPWVPRSLAPLLCRHEHAAILYALLLHSQREPDGTFAWTSGDVCRFLGRSKTRNVGNAWYQIRKLDEGVARCRVNGAWTALPPFTGPERCVAVRASWEELSAMTHHELAVLLCASMYAVAEGVQSTAAVARATNLNEDIVLSCVKTLELQGVHA